MGLHYKMMMIVGRHEHIDQVLSLLRKKRLYCYGSLTRSGQQYLLMQAKSRMLMQKIMSEIIMCQQY